MGRPRYKELYEKAKRSLENYMSPKFTISYYDPGSRDCEHSFDEWRLESDGGIAFCIWKCSGCGMEVNQVLEERIKPEKVPKDPSVSEWSE